MEVTPLLISLDGGIGAGKTTLLAQIAERIPEVTVVPEPVAEWLTLKNEKGESLLELFYQDPRRWAYTFQNCAILTRLLATQNLLAGWKLEPGKLPVIITERSVLTDKHVFGAMLHREGTIDALEWSLYLKWFDASGAARLPVAAVIHLTTGPKTCAQRIATRQRAGESSISEDYLTKLDAQHHAWLDTDQTALPVLRLSTEAGVDVEENIGRVRAFVHEMAEAKAAKGKAGVSTAATGSSAVGASAAATTASASGDSAASTSSSSPPGLFSPTAA